MTFYVFSWASWRLGSFRWCISVSASSRYNPTAGYLRVSGDNPFYGYLESTKLQTDRGRQTALLGGLRSLLSRLLVEPEVGRPRFALPSSCNDVQAPVWGVQNFLTAPRNQG